MAKRFHDAVSRVFSIGVILIWGMFDLDWYLRQVPNRRVARSDRFPRFLRVAWFCFHYVVRGQGAGRSPHPLFEPEWFEPRPGPFVRRPSKKERQGASELGRGSFWTARLDPFAYHLLRGRATLGSPHPLFDATVWAEQHPGARRHRRGPLHHFMTVATDETPMPLPRATGLGVRRVPFVAAAPGVVVTWGQARTQLGDRLDAWTADQRRARAKRVRDDHDAAADAALVARWGARPAPVAADGRPLVSVIMPVRNRPVQVVEAIESVRAQTHADWELVVVDDASTDHTAAVVAGLAAQDPRIKLVEGEGRGVSRARNRAAGAATGRYVCWLDSDNTWTPHYLHTMLTAMAADGVDAAYAAVEAIDGDRTRYRSLDPGPRREDMVALLEVANFVDLNVLVMLREVYDEAGGFDTSLRRTVDYDLVWRVAERHRIAHLPFIGVRYVEDGTATDRITAQELLSWREVVKNNHLVDWAALAAAAPTREEALVSVLVCSRGGWIPSWGTAVSTLDDVATFGADAPDEVEVVIVDDAGSRSSALVLGSLPLLDPRAHVSRTPKPVHRSLATNLALQTSRGARVVLAEAGVRFWPNWLTRLTEAASGRPQARVVQPLTVDARGVVQSAGKAFTGHGAVPADLLAGHPPEDARRLGPAVPVRATGEAVALLRAADLIDVRGLDPLYVESLEIPDLCLRLAAREVGEGAPLPVLGLTATAAPVQRVAPARPLPPEVAEENRRLFTSRWGVQPSDAALWAEAGFERVEPEGPAPASEIPAVALAQGASLGVTTEEAAEADEVTVRRRPPARAGVPRLRWAIKTATPVGPAGEHWGDLHFADALARALEDLGQEVVVDRREGINRPTTDLDDVVLVLRGLQRVKPQPGATSLLWVISHPELVTTAELAGYDRVFAAGLSWSADFGKLAGVPVTPLLQATDPARFTPDAAAPDSGPPVLFVGNSRNIYRPVVRTLVEAGRDVAVFGGMWEKFLPEGYLRGTFVENDRLAAAYRSAGIVLNDHWDDMREQGFVSNRLFDAVASGARVVSDHIDGVEDLFGGMVRTFRSPEEELALVAAGPAGFPAEAQAREIAARVAREHSFAARARTLLEAALAARATAPAAGARQYAGTA